MVRIRLRRMGAKKKPFYRIVVSDKRSPRDGRFIETIGTYDPLTKPETVTLQHARAAHWLGVGAQPSEAVARLLKGASLLDDQGKPVPYEVPAEPVAQAVAEAPVAAAEPVAQAVAEAPVAAAEPVAAEAVTEAVEETTAEATEEAATEAVEESSESDA